jgi:DNA-binding transcriptional LysR family regulator
MHCLHQEKAMELKRLGHLVALADQRNFHRAAQAVHLSQPAFSRSVQAAEAELGFALFERGADVRCTPAGEFVVERARRLLQENSRFQRDVALYRDHEIGELALGFGQFTAARLLPPLLAHLRQRYPRVSVRVQVQSPSYLLAPLKRQELDFFVGDARFAAGDDAFEVRTIGTTAGTFYVREGHPLLSRGSLNMADMAPFGLATGRLPLPAQANLRRLMGIAEADELPIAVECDDILSLKAIIMATDTIMVGTHGLVEQEVASGVLRPLTIADQPKSQSHLAIVSLRGRTFSPVAAYATGFLEELVAKSLPPTDSGRE